LYTGEMGFLSESPRVLGFWIFPGLLTHLRNCIFPKTLSLLSVIEGA
jgi:hypothetical protein